MRAGNYSVPDDATLISAVAVGASTQLLKLAMKGKKICTASDKNQLRLCLHIQVLFLRYLHYA
jgi:hypothetical protein